MKNQSELMSDAELAYGVWRQLQIIRAKPRIPPVWEDTMAATQSLWIHAARMADRQNKDQPEG